MAHKVLILGITGMLGHVIFKHLFRDHRFEVSGTIRSSKNISKWFTKSERERIIAAIDAEKIDSVSKLIDEQEPSVVINCIGIIKQLPISKLPVPAITINALFPHQLAKICHSINARLIHISTDCIFSGKKGCYTEDDQSDAEDLYGRTKYIGEVTGDNCITLRTSIIGHELKSKFGLVEWFLAQNNSVKGFTNAIYSGFPTTEMAKIISDVVIPNLRLSGLYHVSSEPISKYELLRLVAKTFKKSIDIDPYDDFKCDRSLVSNKFKSETGYKSPKWSELVEIMHASFISESG